MSGDEAREAADVLATFCDAWEASGLSETIAATADAARDGEAPGMRRRKLKLSTLRAVLAENARLQDELDRANHSAKRCPVTNDHPLYGPFRCDLPTHVSPDHFGGPPGFWVKWLAATAPQQPAPSEPGRVRAEGEER